MKQLITVAPDGSISGLQMKRGHGIDLREFGNADIQRTSLIEWSSAEQRWFIRFLHRKDGGPECYSCSDFHKFGIWPLHSTVDADGVMYFDDYEDAVDVEVDVVQATRQRFGHDAV